MAEEKWEIQCTLAKVKKMTSLAILFNHRISPICSIPSDSRFPAKSRRCSVSTAKSRANRLLYSSYPATDNRHGENEKHSFISNRRRVLIWVPTIPFLLRFHDSVEDFSLKAAASDTDTYLLIKGEVRKAVSKSKAAGVLRLVFHDAGTFELDENSGGMNGSIIYELDRPENAGLMKSIKILEKAKREVDRIQPVSWADMIAVAGAEAVSICGGPTIPVALGRLDTLGPDAKGNLPQESLDAFGLKQCFQKKGLSTQELVALSGAHTLGSKGFGSPVVFDNSYYKILLQKPWMSSGGMSSMIGLPSDHALVEDEECSRFYVFQELLKPTCSSWIKKYADDENLFFEDFKNAYVKLVNSGARWRSL